MEENKILELNNISSFVNKRFLVKNVSLTLHKNEVAVVLGENGSGKSSLCKLIAGALPLSGGDIYIEGKNLALHELLTREISISLDPPVFFKYQSVLENIKYLLKLKRKYNRSSVLETLKALGIDKLTSAMPLSLTEREKKLITLGCALAQSAKVYILDEPFKGLNEDDVEILKKMIERTKDCAFLLTGNFKEDFEDIANTFIYMTNREITSAEKNERWANFNKNRYSFIETKQPNFLGKILKGQGKEALIENNKVLFTKVNNDELENLLNLLKEKKLTIYSAGFSEKGEEVTLDKFSEFYKKD